MIVRRGHVLEDALRRAGRDQFSPTKRIEVTTSIIIHMPMHIHSHTHMH